MRRCHRRCHGCGNFIDVVGGVKPADYAAALGWSTAKQTNGRFKSRHVKFKKKKKKRKEGRKTATFTTFAQFDHMGDHLGFDFFFYLICSF